MVSFLAEMACTDDRLFVSYMQTDLLELYDVEGSLLKRMQGPDGFFPHIREVSDGRYSKTTSVKGESRDAYFTPVAVNGKFYVSYTGASVCRPACRPSGTSWSSTRTGIR